MGKSTPNIDWTHRSGCATAHTSWLATSLPASTSCKISLLCHWHSSLRSNATEQHHYGYIPFCNLTHCQSMYHQKVKMKLKKTQPMNLEDLRMKTGMAMLLTWILGLCEITPLSWEIPWKINGYCDFLDRLEYRLEFEDERMLDMVEHEVSASGSLHRIASVRSITWICQGAHHHQHGREKHWIWCFITQGHLVMIGIVDQSHALINQ